jgi:hypothetical protein
MKRSASLFRRWGQQVTGNVIIGGLAHSRDRGAAHGPRRVRGAAGNAGAAIGGGAIIVIGLVIAVAGAVFAGATRGVFGVALYRYVADDQALGPFTVQDLEGAARTR